MQNANRARLRIVGAKRIRTDELGEVSRLMRRCLAQRPHLVQHDGDVLPRDLPGRLAAGKAAADHMDGSQPMDGGERSWIGHGALMVIRIQPPCKDKRGSGNRREDASGLVEAKRGRNLEPMVPHANDAREHQKRTRNKKQT